LGKFHLELDKLQIYRAIFHKPGGFFIITNLPSRELKIPFHATSHSTPSQQRPSMVRGGVRKVRRLGTLELEGLG